MINNMKNFLLKYKKILSYIFFAIITSLVNVSVYMICFKFVLSNIIFSNIIAYSCSITISFFLNKKVVFKNKQKKYFKQFMTYVGLKMISLCIDSVVLTILHDFFHINNFIAKLVANASTTISNYLVNKCVIFKNKS